MLCSADQTQTKTVEMCKHGDRFARSTLLGKHFRHFISEMCNTQQTDYFLAEILIPALFNIPEPSVCALLTVRFHKHSHPKHHEHKKTRTPNSFSLKRGKFIFPIHVMKKIYFPVIEKMRKEEKKCISRNWFCYGETSTVFKPSSSILFVCSAVKRFLRSKIEADSRLKAIKTQQEALTFEKSGEMNYVWLY